MPDSRAFPCRAAANNPSTSAGRGVGHFDKTFCNLTPHKRDLEASHECDLAIAEFQRELAVRPSSAAAHGHLACIHDLRKQFDKAAAHYDKLAGLDPFNTDACVLAALAWAEDGRLAEAPYRLLYFALATNRLPGAPLCAAAATGVFKYHRHSPLQKTAIHL